MYKSLPALVLATDRQSRQGFLYFLFCCHPSVSNGRSSAVCLLSENSGKPLLQKFTEKFEAFAFSKDMYVHFRVHQFYQQLGSPRPLTVAQYLILRHMYKNLGF
jgi:hypothetical protein